MSEVRPVNSDEFAGTIASAPVVFVKLYTQGCPACARFAPTFERLAKEYEGQAVFLELEARENMQVAKDHRVRGVPTVLAFKNGEEAQRLTGAKTLAEMREWMSPVLS